MPYRDPDVGRDYKKHWVRWKRKKERGATRMECVADMLRADLIKTRWVREQHD